MTNEEARRACDEIHNTFWRKWRNRKLVRQSQEWEQIHAEAVSILERNPFPLAEHMIRDFLDELEARTRERESR